MTSRRKSVTINSKSGSAGPRRRDTQAADANRQGQDPQSENVADVSGLVEENVVESHAAVSPEWVLPPEEGLEGSTAIPDQSEAQPDEMPEDAAAVPDHVDELIQQVKLVQPVSAYRAFWYKPLYKSLFYVSFGAVYGALFVNRLLPEEGAVARGLRDGGRAARSAYLKRMQERNQAMSALQEAKT